MHFDFESERPLFLQVADALKDDIVRGILDEETQIPSGPEIAVTYKINPATVNKGVNLLVEEGLVYKKRGIGMFVAAGAKAKLVADASAGFYDSYIQPMLDAAAALRIDRSAILRMIEKGAKQ